MKYVDAASLFDGDRSEIALLTTYQFDPDYFERRLLRCTALQKARRIVIFVDRSEWLALLRRDAPARYVNRRYLVVPVRRANGRFHSKLSLLLSESGGRVLCGSNNLTRAGCSSNLELLNSVCFEFGNSQDAELDVAKEAFYFFEEAVKHTSDEVSRIASDWLGETASAFPWLRVPVGMGQRPMRLLHSYDAPLWNQIAPILTDTRPKEFFMISPFHDADARLLTRLSRGWPEAKIEVLAQQGYTTLPVPAAKRLAQLRLAEIRDTSRRLHAKLLVWRHRSGSGCLIGSANFTCAAFDGGNVEACLLFSDASRMVEGLFDRELRKHPIALKDFEPGVREPFPADDPSLFRLTIESAALIGDDKIRVSYSHNLKGVFSLALAIRVPGERHPRIRVPISAAGRGDASVQLPHNGLADASGALLASLSAEISGESVEGPFVWVIQEDRLTYEPGEGGGTTKKRVEETGQGLPELLDEIGNRDGIRAVVEFLQHFNIRFFDGDSGTGANRRFQIQIRDPFQPDVAPDWLHGLPSEVENLGSAIMEFVERHEKHRLRRHAKRGNINGMENFLDIFTALVRILYVYSDRGVLKRGKLLGRLCRFIELATKGGTTLEGDEFAGYLSAVAANVGRGSLLRDRCEETNYLPVVATALLIARRIRADGEKLPARDFLPTWARMLEEVTRESGLRGPTRDKVRDAFEAYRMLRDEDVGQLLTQLDESHSARVPL